MPCAGKGSHFEPSRRGEDEPHRATPAGEGEDEAHCAEPLGDDRRPGGAGETEIEPEDEHRVEDEVHEVETEGDDEGSAGVERTAEHAVPNGHEQHGRQGKGTDAQIGRCRIDEVWSGAQGAQQRPWKTEQHAHHRHAEHQADHCGGDGDAARTRSVVAAELSRHEGGGSVREEVENGERDPEDGGRNGKRTQRGRAETANVCSIDQRHERVGCQSPERRQCEPEDLFVVGRPAKSPDDCDHGPGAAVFCRYGHRSASGHSQQRGVRASQMSRPNWMMRIEMPAHSRDG